MAKNEVRQTQTVKHFILEGTSDYKKAVRFARGEQTEADITSEDSPRYLLNSQNIVTIDDESMKERAKGVTRIFMSRGATFYVPADVARLTDIFEENGYKVYSMGEIAGKPKTPQP